MLPHSKSKETGHVSNITAAVVTNNETNNNRLQHTSTLETDLGMEVVSSESRAKVTGRTEEAVVPQSEKNIVINKNNEKVVQNITDKNDDSSDEEHIDLDKLNNVPDLKSEVKKLRRKLSEHKKTKLRRKNSYVEDVGTGLVQVVGGVGTVTATIANDVVLKPLAFALNPLATLFVPPPSQDQLQKAYLTDDEALFVEDEEIDDLILN